MTRRNDDEDLEEEKGGEDEEFIQEEFIQEEFIQEEFIQEEYSRKGFSRGVFLTRLRCRHEVTVTSGEGEVLQVVYSGGGVPP